MDAESGEHFLGGGGGEGGMLADSWQLATPFSSDLVFSSSEDPLQDWAMDPEGTLNDSESEDILHGVDPNEVFPSGPPAKSSSESDSGVSEDPVVPFSTATAASILPVYQVVYDIGSLGSPKNEPGQENVISIELDGWSSQVLFSDSCIVNQLPVVRLDDPQSPDGDMLLTEEEQKLLTQEGVSLPNNLPLTKAEERILKRVRRKIRNKQSAQDSRRRRKEYVDGLESRAVTCSAQNKELQTTVEHLKKHNMSLLAQLGRLQSLIKETVSKGAQTSTCLLLVLVSLGLIIMPSFSPFSRNSSADDDYRPTGVVSRNILTDPFSQPTADDGNVSAVQSDSSSPHFELGQSGSPVGTAILQEPIVNPENTGFDELTPEGSQLGNSSALVSGQTEPLVLGQRKGSRDPAKPAHADEM
ncbi:cyclic AMP-responsive element-binding protein 3-like protein 4 [Cyclopterus lumpus]|uniref:cyclic AMP-responsive element-binding protein 3-like protein 4 n=1 Tax=Cyclopterus lumpus TaxID=8103 RepID=UPI001485DA2B|nr:cyclic AMP-responsive element-binding protein 3-like protein 4 [Cyclopterus lumpus]XP_034409836.1 cyclic AMP-responsive element-binding protein 3-like protein 4 [Cyclopterus lumpus]